MQQLPLPGHGHGNVMLRLSACTADCALGCGLIETAHIHNSRASSPPSSAVSRADAAGCARNEPPPPFRVVIWARTRAHCAQWDFKSGLYSLFLVCSSQSVHLHSAYLVLPRNLYLLLESIYTHKQSSGSCNSSEIISSCSCCTWVSFRLLG